MPKRSLFTFAGNSNSCYYTLEFSISFCFLSLALKINCFGPHQPLFASVSETAYVRNFIFPSLLFYSLSLHSQLSLLTAVAG